VKISVHLKLLFDGEEESGSPHMNAFLTKNKALLKADTLIVPDLVNPSLNHPSITFSLRGLIEFKVKISSIKRAVHSGLGGGVIPDPTAILAQLYANALGKNGEVIIPGIRVGKNSIVKNRNRIFSEINFSEAKLRKEFLLPSPISFLQKGKERFYNALWFSPALTLLNLQIAQPGNYANRIQTDVEAVFSLRLAPQQNPKKIGPILKRYFTQNVPANCKVDFKILHEANGFYTDPQADYFQDALKAASLAYGKKALAIGSGLSIPFVHTIQKRLGSMDTILLGIEDPQSNAHAENESISIPMFKKTILTLVNLLC
jgi:acetylornithine deacetylase/succinyl-diaminopimelate desuccinylase-like protein